MRESRRWWVVSLMIHAVIILVAAGVTVAEGEVEGEPGYVQLVSEDPSSAWVWLDERLFPREGLSEVLDVSFEAGTHGPDVTVPERWDHSDQLLERSTSKPGKFEDDDEVVFPIPSESGCACKKSPCTCDPVSVGSVFLTCSCEQSFILNLK